MTTLLNVDNPNLQFNEGNHTYVYKGSTILPSVTKIMQPLSDDIYTHIDPEVLRFAAHRGTNVHYATELYDTYGVEEVEEECRGYLEAYKKFKEDFKPIIKLCEFKTYHKQFYYAGTIDRLAEIDGESVLVDIKTTAQLHQALVSVQVSAYREMLISQGIKVDKVGVLQLKADGSYTFEYLDDNFEIFMALFKIHMFKKINK